MLRHKVLSSGVIKGVVGQASNSRCIVDRSLNGLDGFWIDYSLQVLDASGQVLAGSTVTGFDATGGAVSLKEPLKVEPIAGQGFELSARE